MKASISAKTLELLKEHHQKKNASALLHLAARTQIRHPNSIVGRVYTARGLALMKRYSEAAEILESIVTPFPGLRKIWSEWLHCLKKSRQMIVWEIQAERFLRQHFSEKIAFELGRHCLSQGRYQEALTQFRRIMERSENARVWKSRLAMAMALCSFELGNLRDCEEWLNDFGGTRARRLRIRLLEKEGKLAQALMNLRELPDYERSPALLQKGYRLSYRLGDEDGQILALESLLGHSSSPSRRLQFLSRLEELYRRKKDLKSVCATLRRRLGVNAKEPNTLHRLGLALEERGEYAKARKVLEEYTRLRPFSPEGLLDFVRVLRHLGEEHLAFEQLRAAWLLGAQEESLGLDLSSEYLRRQRVEESRKVLESVLERHGGSSQVYAMLALCARQSGNSRLQKHYESLAERLAA